MSFFPAIGQKNITGQASGKPEPSPVFPGTSAPSGRPGLSQTLSGGPELRTDGEKDHQWFSSVWNSLIAGEKSISGSGDPSGDDAVEGKDRPGQGPAAVHNGFIGQSNHPGRQELSGSNIQPDQPARQELSGNNTHPGQPGRQEISGNNVQPDQSDLPGNKIPSDAILPSDKEVRLDNIPSEQKTARPGDESKSAGADKASQQSLKIAKLINTEQAGKEITNDTEARKSLKVAKHDTPSQGASKVAESDKKPSFVGISQTGTVTATNGRSTAFPAGVDHMPGSGESHPVGQSNRLFDGENKEIKGEGGRTPVHHRYPAEIQEKDRQVPVAGPKFPDKKETIIRGGQEEWKKDAERKDYGEVSGKKVTPEKMTSGDGEKDSVDQRLRFASLTREFARRMEQIVRPGTSSGFEGKSGRDSGVKSVDAGKMERDTGMAENAQEKVKPEPMTGQNGKLNADLVGRPALNHGDKMVVEQTADSGNRVRSERYQEHIRSWAERSDATLLPRIPVVTNGSSAVNRPMPSRVAMMPVAAGYTGESLSIKEELEWEKTGVAESKEDNEDAGSDESPSYTRYGRLAMINTDLRREVMPGMTKLVQSARESEQARQGSWQNHRFSMEDGKNIRVSVREMDGVLQLRLGSSSTELGRLLQQHLQEIKEHLEKECDIEIDLQLDGQSADGFAGLFDDRAGKHRTEAVPGQAGESTEEVRVEKVAPQSIRDFGYNQMEWTA